MRLLDLWWWLRSTRGSYGRLVLEAAYGKIAISLHRGCLGDISSGRVVGVSTWCITHGRHTRVNTSMGTVYVFLIFNTKIYTYYVLKSICIIKGHWWSLTLSWPDDDQGMISTAHDVFLKRNEKIHRFIIIVSLRIEIYLYTCFIHTTCMTTCYYMLSLSFSPRLVYGHSYPSLSTWFAHTPTVFFLQANHLPFCIERRWSRLSLLHRSLVR